MNKLAICFVLAAFLSGACSDETPSLYPNPDEESAATVCFRLEAQIETDTSVEPMTRATAYKEWFSNTCRLLVLKKSSRRWIVDRTQTVLLDANSRPSDILKLSDTLQPCSFAFEMRPGDYRLVAVINPQSAVWNEELVTGTVVADENDPSLRTPPLLSYLISTHPANRGYRGLYREIFVATTEFTVPKSGDLHASGMPAVTLKAERRVGKIRMLLKNTPSPKYGFEFDLTPYTFRMLFTASERPFAEGIDALGGMYYSESGLYELPWCMSTYGGFYPAGDASYLLCQTNSTVFSPFVFADPDAGDLSFEITDIGISGASGDPTFMATDAFTRTLAASKITGIVFQTTDAFDQTVSPIVIDVREATDASGNVEDATALFDPYFEWNAATN